MKRFLKIWQGLKFWWNATNQHGIHSPFVFNLITHCLYDKTPLETYKLLANTRINNKSLKLLIKILSYFQFKKIESCEGLCPNTKSILKINHRPLKHQAQFPLKQLFYYDQLQTENLQRIFKLAAIANSDVVIFVRNIRASNMAYKNWLALVNNPKVKVSIDVYYVGLLFFRKEQAKEHFCIRPKL